TVVPGTVSGRRASSAARRARFIPCRSCGNPHPTITSRISSRGSSRTLSSADEIANAARSSGRASTSDPFRARPIGVRAAATMTASPGGEVDHLSDERRLLLILDLDLHADGVHDTRPAPLGAQQL